MKLRPPMLERAVGAVVGGAAGDALGAGYEFTTPSPDESIRFKRGSMGFAPGEWTDDTAQANAILRVVAEGRVDLDAIGAGFLEWFADGPRDVGNSTRAVLARADGDPARLRASADAYFAAHPRGAAGNGSLMRTAPVAIAHIGDDEGMARAAREISHLTHGDPLAAEACVLWCIAIERAIVEGRLDGVWDGLDLLDDEAAGRWGAWLQDAETYPPESFKDNGFVVVALQAAHAAISQTPVPDEQPARHLQAALEAAVRIGNDTDTVAAIAGQVLGARWGVSAIPARWRRQLFGWPGWQYRDLLRASVRAARGGRDDADGWPSAPSMIEWGLVREPTPVCVEIPGTERLLAGNLPGLAVALERGVDAVVSLCRVGQQDVPRDVEHVEVWLADRFGGDFNPNLGFVLDDTVDVLGDLLDEGKRVYVHCVGGHSRTPTVVSAYLARTTGRSAVRLFDDLGAVLPIHHQNEAFHTARAAIDERGGPAADTADAAQVGVTAEAYEAYRDANFVDPAPPPRFASARLGGSAIYVAEYRQAIAFYSEVLGPPSYVEGDHTHGWRVGRAWLTVFPASKGAPRNAELHLYCDTVEEAGALHAAIIAAGGSGGEPVDALMFEPVRFHQAWDPFGTSIVVLAPLDLD